jgi:hypothetical protein
MQLRALKRRLRCLRRTRGLHEWDLSSGKCRLCRQVWSESAVEKHRAEQPVSDLDLVIRRPEAAARAK